MLQHRQAFIADMLQPQVTALQVGGGEPVCCSIEEGVLSYLCLFAVLRVQEYHSAHPCQQPGRPEAGHPPDSPSAV